MDYNTEELDKLVSDYISHRYKMKDAKTNNDEDNLTGYDMDLFNYFLINKLPKLAFSVILKILEKDSSDIVIDILAVGELEDLLSEHGKLIITEIEDEARKNPQFKKMLGGVWQGDMSDEIYKRVIIAAGGEDARW